MACPGHGEIPRRLNKANKRKGRYGASFPRGYVESPVRRLHVAHKHLIKVPEAIDHLAEITVRISCMDNRRGRNHCNNLFG